MREEARHSIGVPEFEKPSGNMAHIGGQSVAEGRASSLTVCKFDGIGILFF
jgi:hypothetical protein